MQKKIESKNLNNSEIYFTDIAPSEIILKKLIVNYSNKIYVYDHYIANIGIKEFMDSDHCFIEPQFNGKTTSGTEIFYHYVKDKIKELRGIDINKVEEFVKNV